MESILLGYYGVFDLEFGCATLLALYPMLDGFTPYFRREFALLMNKGDFKPLTYSTKKIYICKSTRMLYFLKFFNGYMGKYHLNRVSFS